MHNGFSFDFSELRANGITRVGEFNPYVTLACDLRCSYCYMFDFLTKANDVVHVMPTGWFVSLMDHICEEGGGLDRMTFLGGEPTLHPDITTMMNEAAQRPIKERRMTTNGMGLHHLNLDKVSPEALDHVSVSIDGTTAEANDVTRAKNSFKRIVETIGLYRQAGFKISVNYTVTNRNIANLNETVPYFHSMGVSIINLHRASLDGNAYRNPDIIIDAMAWISARAKLVEFLKKDGGLYPGLTVRIPYIFMTDSEVLETKYAPIQERNYHSPDGGHRLIVFPATSIGRGLCYMSSDVIGHPNAELGRIDDQGRFLWNWHDNNELIAFSRHKLANVSSLIKNQTQEVNPGDGLVRVSHSFKLTMRTAAAMPGNPIREADMPSVSA